jgi:uncharacterized membrane protein
MLKKVAALASVGMTISAPAQAQMQIAGCCIWVRDQYGYWHGYHIVTVIFLLGLFLTLVKLLEWFINHSSSSDSSEEHTASDQAERYEEEARRLRALKYKTDAETDLTASLIDKARIDAAYKELNQITTHDREVRRLSRHT